MAGAKDTKAGSENRDQAKTEKITEPTIQIDKERLEAHGEEEPASREENSQSSPRIEPNQALLRGRFRLVRKCGFGGMGVVYEAIDSHGKEETRVALKFPNLIEDAFERIQAEVLVAKTITHPNVCRIFDAHQDGDIRFISMEYVPDTLVERIENCGTGMDLQEILRLAKGIGSGLVAIHKAGKVHQDLKPGNILITSGGDAKITDFGLTSGHFQGFGTVQYMAPEGATSPASDIFAVGLILYEMLTGNMACPRGIFERPRIRAALAKPTISRQLADLILKCLEDDPKRRPDASKLISLIDSIKLPVAIGQGPPFNLRPRSAPEKEWASPLRTKIIASIGWTPSTSSVENLAKKLLAVGADIIRLKLATCNTLEQVGELVSCARSAIESFEKANGTSRLHAIWADLPGPNLRLELIGPPPTERGSFLVSISSKGPSKIDARLYSGSKPFKDALAEIDQDYTQDKLMSCGDFGEEPDEHRHMALGFRPHGFLLESRLLENLRAGANSGDAYLVSADTGLVLNLVQVHWEDGWLEFRVLHPGDSTKDMPVGFRGLDCWLPTCTKQDLAFAERVLEIDLANRDPAGTLVGFFGLRHVQTADEILRLQFQVENQLMKTLDLQQEAARIAAPAIIATIESRLGWENRHYLLDVADGVNVGDGDLALPSEQSSSPERRRRLVILANKRGKPAIGLCNHSADPEPGRDTTKDVFSMVQAGLDAMVLPLRVSEEPDIEKVFKRLISITASAEDFYEFKGVDRADVRAGLRRSRLLEFMKDDYERIKTNRKRLDGIVFLWHQRFCELKGPGEDAAQLQASWRVDLYHHKLTKARKQEITNRITEAACLLAETDNVKAIVTASTTGRTTRMIARMRSDVVTIGATHDAINARKLTISYGVIPYCISVNESDDGMEKFFRTCEAKFRENKFVSELLRGLVIFTCGFPLKRPGATNLIQLRPFAPTTE